MKSARERSLPGQRPLRVGEALRHALAHILERGELRDPDLQGTAITVTEVRLSPDLKRGTAFVMPLGGARAPEVLAALHRSAPFLRRELARAVRLRHAPEIDFALDTSFEHAERIDRLLHRPEVERDLKPSAEDDGAENGA